MAIRRLAKLVSLLSTRALYFSQLARLGDRFEGTLTRERFERHEAYVQQKVAKSKAVGGHWAGVTHGIRGYTFVNCWCLRPVESDALWRIYGRESGGVAIRTTYANLRDVLSDYHMIGLVRYLDYETGVIETGNELRLAMHKRRVFEYEQEVRAAQFYIPKRDSKQAAWISGPPPQESQDAPPAGLVVGVDLEALVDAVVISPYAPHWYKGIVEKLVESFDLSIPVEESSMAAAPLQDYTPITEDDRRVMELLERSRDTSLGKSETAELE